MTAIGIDLGTTFCTVAVVEGSAPPRVLANREGERITPSVIYFGDDVPLVGTQAREMQALGDENVAYLFKRAMGDPHFSIHQGGVDYDAVALSTLLLKHLKADAESALGCEVEQAVITVPAYFNDQQRRATLKAGEDSGFEVLRIINEPTAAALAYGVGKGQDGQNVLVYDLGGGTFDISLVKMEKDVIRVLATDGDHHLGGRDWDDRITIWLANCFEEEFGSNPLDDSVSAGDLLVRCENAKKHLSTRESVRITIDHNGDRARYSLSQKLFEEQTADLMERTQKLTEQVLVDRNMSWDQLTGVLLVGGSTRMPMVRKYVHSMSGRPAMTGVNVDEAVALGAALQASHDVALRSQSEQGSRPRLGARRALDVMSHSLGVVAVSKEGDRYLNSIIIPKNRAIPCTESRPFQLDTLPGSDNELEVYMLQGESDQPLDCSVLGRYHFREVSHVSKGKAVLDIQYAYDSNGLVNVAALDRATGKELPLEIESLPEDLSWLGLPPEQNLQGGKAAHLTVVLAVDLSGSMSGQPLVKAQEAACGFLEQLDLTRTTIGLLCFADKVKVSQKLCQDARKLSRSVAAWKSWMDDGKVGWGNSAEPFTECQAILDTVTGPRYIIVLTDGIWNDQNQAVRAARECHQADIEVIALGFGQADEHFLAQIASSDANALKTDLIQLKTSLSKIAQVFTSGSHTVALFGE